jgi:hypothetical protein
MTLITKKPLSGDSDRIGTFIFPPGIAGNKHPIRVLQFDHNNQACPKDHWLIMASMQIESERDSELKAFKDVVLKFCPFEVVNADACEVQGEEEQKSDEVVFAVLYLQDSAHDKHRNFIKQIGASNIFAAQDANFDLDLDPHFSEARSLFYSELQNTKEGENKVKFLKGPKEVMQQYEYNADSGSDSEQKMLANLGEEMGIPTSPFTQHHGGQASSESVNHAKQHEKEEALQHPSTLD